MGRVGVRVVEEGWSSGLAEGEVGVVGWVMGKWDGLWGSEICSRLRRGCKGEWALVIWVVVRHGAGFGGGRAGW